MSILSNWCFHSDNECESESNRNHKCKRDFVSVTPVQFNISTKDHPDFFFGVSPFLITSNVDTSQKTRFEIKGPKLALVVHGLNGSNHDTNSLAQFLLKEYDTVIQYQYDYTLTIEAIAATMVKQLAPILRLVKKCDFVLDSFAHSLGGLVVRYALKFLGLIKYSPRFFSINSLQHGSPTAVHDAFHAVLIASGQTRAANSAASAETISGTTDQPFNPDATPFLKKLNSRPSKKYRERAQYFSIGSTRFITYIPFPPPAIVATGQPSLGALINSVFISLDPTDTNDGQVSTRSANSEALALDSESWAHNFFQRGVTTQDHYSTIGVITNIIPPGQTIDLTATFVPVPEEVQRFLLQFIRGRDLDEKEYHLIKKKTENACCDTN